MTASSPQPRTPLGEIAGLVERVTFFNEESGFAVLRVKVRGQRDLVTVLGSLPSINVNVTRAGSPIPQSFPNQNEGAHGPSLLGTGDGNSQSSRQITPLKS